MKSITSSRCVFKILTEANVVQRGIRAFLCCFCFTAWAFTNDTRLEWTDQHSLPNGHMVALANQSLHDWVSSKIIESSDKVSARTAILIIAPPRLGNYSTELRWALGKKTWEQYMNCNPCVDCYFLQTAPPRKDKDDSEQVWIEGNTIYVGDIYQEKYGNDRILYKTIAALKHLSPYYTHFIRTNLNTFFNLSAVSAYMETHSASLFTTPVWQTAWYAIGYGVIFTKDVAEHIVREYERLETEGSELISHHHADDGAITALATGIWPYDPDHPFCCCSALPTAVRQVMCEDSFSTDRISKYGVLLLPPITLDTAIQYCEQAGDTPMLYRNREGFTLQELAKLYEYLLQKVYPEIHHNDLEEYVNSL